MQHRSLEERLSAAQILVQKEPLCPVVVDEMNDVAAVKYGALPERLYVLQAGNVVYKVRFATLIKKTNIFCKSDEGVSKKDFSLTVPLKQ